MTNGAGTTGMAGLLPYAAGGAGIGQAISGLLGGGGYEDAIRKAMEQYGAGMGKATGALEQREAAGREDILRALEEAQKYGAPYREAGATGLESLLGSLGLGGSAAQRSAMQAFHTSPGYQFALEQGLKGVQRGLGARGLTGSGREAKELSRYATGLAEQEYGDWQKQLAGLAGGGQTAAEQAAQRQYGTGGSLAQLGLGYGSQLADLYSQLAQAQAESGLAGAAAGQQRAGGLGGLLGGLGGAALGMPGVGSAVGGLLGGLF